MTSYIPELKGRKVAIWSGGEQSGARDEGILDGFDGTAVRLRKEQSGGSFEYLIFPIYRIRLIKPID